MLSERAEEILEALWIQIEEGHKRYLDIGASKDEPAIEELIKLGYIHSEGGHLYLLDKGKSHALACIRRHRLSERLMVDLFDIKKNFMDEASCKFEHILHKGLEDNVCILLGHPKVCPHGKPIPPGKCCIEKRDKKLLKIIAPLSELDVRDKGQIAYLYTKDRSKMQKLMNIGVLPGNSIMLLQKFPSYVFQIGKSQFAIDKDLASAIYVRLIE